MTKLRDSDLPLAHPWDAEQKQRALNQHVVSKGEDGTLEVERRTGATTSSGDAYDGSFSGRLAAQWQQTSPLVQGHKMQRVQQARAADLDVQVTEHQLFSGIEPQYHVQLVQELERGNAWSALELKEQIRKDVENNQVLDDVGILAGLGYGVLAAVTQPESVALGIVSGGAGVASGQLVKSVVSSPIAKTLTEWAVGSAVGAATYNYPRVQGDVTYNMENFYVDVALETLLGVGLGSMGKGASVLSAKYKNNRADKLQAAVDTAVEKERVMKGDTSGFEPSDNLSGKQTYNSWATGKMSEEDIATYKAKERKPATGNRLGRLKKAEAVMDEKVYKANSLLEQQAWWSHPARTNELRHLEVKNDMRAAGIPEAKIDALTERQALEIADAAQDNQYAVRLPYGALPREAAKLGDPVVATDLLNLNQSVSQMLKTDTTMKWAQYAAIDRVSRLNGDWMVMRRQLDLLEAEGVADNIDSSILRSMRRVDNTVKYLSTKPIRSTDDLVDMITSLDSLREYMGSVSERIDKGDIAKRVTDDASVQLGYGKDTDVYGDTIDDTVWADLDSIRKDVESRSTSAMYPDSLKDLELVVAHNKAMRKQKANARTRKVLKADVFQLEDMKGLTHQQFTTVIDTINHNQAVKDKLTKMGVLQHMRWLNKQMGSMQPSPVRTVLERTARDLMTITTMYGDKYPANVEAQLRAIVNGSMKEHHGNILYKIHDMSPDMQLNVLSDYNTYVKNLLDEAGTPLEITHTPYDLLMENHGYILQEDARVNKALEDEAIDGIRSRNDDDSGASAWNLDVMDEASVLLDMKKLYDTHGDSPEVTQLFSIVNQRLAERYTNTAQGIEAQITELGKGEMPTLKKSRADAIAQAREEGYSPYETLGTEAIEANKQARAKAVQDQQMADRKFATDMVVYNTQLADWDKAAADLISTIPPEMLRNVPVAKAEELIEATLKRQGHVKPTLPVRTKIKSTPPAPKKGRPTAQWNNRIAQIMKQKHDVYANDVTRNKLNGMVRSSVADKYISEPVLPTGFANKKMYKKNAHDLQVMQDMSDKINAITANEGLYSKIDSLDFQRVTEVYQVKEDIARNLASKYKQAITRGDLIAVSDVIRAAEMVRKDKQAKIKQIETRRKNVLETKTRIQGMFDAADARFAEAEAKAKAETDALDAQKEEVAKDMPLADSDNNLAAANLTALNSDTSELPESVINAAAESMARESVEKQLNGIAEWANTWLPVEEEASKPRTITGAIGSYMGKLFGMTQQLRDTLANHSSTAMKYIAYNLTETGKGYGGAISRKHSSALVREAEYAKAVSMVVPSYTKLFDEWLVQTKGASAVSRLAATTQGGGANEYAKEFNRLITSAMNSRRLGRKASEHPIITKFLEDWTKFTDHAHDTLVAADAAGFTAEKKLRNYIPQVWNAVTIRKLNDTNPTLLRKVLTEGYRKAGFMTDAESLADNLVRNVLDDANTAFDPYSPHTDARAKQRIRIDWDAEVDGMSVSDLLETDVPTIATKYSNRMAGWVGLSKGTEGLIKNGADINAFRSIISAETRGDKRALQDFDDVIDLLFGRPTRGGVPDWARSFRDLASLTRMGGLGTAQAIESSNMLTRILMENAEDKKFLSKITKGLSSDEAAADLLELQKLTGYDFDVEYLHRQSVYLDSESGEVSALKRAGNMAANAITGGSLKAPASRLLGKTTGHNAVRKYQEAVMQRSFGFAVMRHFNGAGSKMSVARLADLGLTDVNGNNDKLKATIMKHVEFDDDGYPMAYHFDKWDVDARDTFWYALQRAEAQDLSRALVGELPRWMNIPGMNVAMQFRQVPLLSGNKQLARSLAFADKEAVTQLALSTMVSGAVRGAKMATLAAGYAAIKGTSFGEEWDLRMRNADMRGAVGPMNMGMYVSQAGMFPDIYQTSVALGNAWEHFGNEEYSNSAGEILGQVPMLSLMGSYIQTGEAVGSGKADEAVKHVQGITMLGNTAYMEMLFTALEEYMKED